MHYTLHQLEIFSKVCEFKSISKAAEAMHLTQPAISIQLKKLQQQFDVQLTEIIGRQLYVTEFGHRLLEITTEILERTNLIAQTTVDYKGLVSGKMKIASVSTGKYVIPFFLNSFSKAHPQVDIAVEVTNKNLVIQSLVENSTDFALVSVMPEMALHKVKLMDNELQFFCGQEYYHLGKKIAAKQLAEIPLILREKGSATRVAMEDFLKKKNITHYKSMELTSNEAVKQAVIAGLGISLMPMIGLRFELKQDALRPLQLSGLPISTQWNLVWSKGKQFTPAATAFLSHIKAHKQEVIDDFFMG